MGSTGVHRYALAWSGVCLAGLAIAAGAARADKGDVGGEAYAGLGKAQPRRVLIAQPVSLSAGLSDRLVGKVGGLLREAFAKAGTTPLEQAEVAALRQGGAEIGGERLTKARLALERGKDAYLNFEYNRSLAELATARQLFLEALPHGGEFMPLAEALVYLGANELSLGKQAAAQKAFLELLKLRPKYVVDPKVHGPEVIDAFDQARGALARVTTSSVAVSSAPPLASVELDGEPRGETPVTIEEIPVGTHALRVSLAGHRPHCELVEVKGRGQKLEIRLEENLAGEQLETLEKELSGAGTRAVGLEAARGLAKSAAVDAVVLLGVAQLEGLYLLVAAMVDSAGAVHVAHTTVDLDFLRASQASEALVASLLAESGPTFVDAGSGEPEASFDFEARLLGIPGARATAAGHGGGGVAQEGSSGGEGFSVLPWLFGGVAGIGVATAAAAGGGAYYMDGLVASHEQTGEDRLEARQNGRILVGVAAAGGVLAVVGLVAALVTGL